MWPIGRKAAQQIKLGAGFQLGQQPGGIITGAKLALVTGFHQHPLAGNLAVAAAQVSVDVINQPSPGHGDFTAQFAKPQVPSKELFGAAARTSFE